MSNFVMLDAVIGQASWQHEFASSISVCGQQKQSKILLRQIEQAHMKNRNRAATDQPGVEAAVPSVWEVAEGVWAGVHLLQATVA